MLNWKTEIWGFIFCHIFAPYPSCLQPYPSFLQLPPSSSPPAPFYPPSFHLLLIIPSTLPCTPSSFLPSLLPSTVNHPFYPPLYTPPPFYPPSSNLLLIIPTTLPSTMPFPFTLHSPFYPSSSLLPCPSLVPPPPFYPAPPGGGLMTTFGDFWGLMGTKNHGDWG